jgi:hypothetical protein
VTPTEIRAKGFVLYVRNISSISVGTVRPGKWFAPLFAFPIVMMFAIWLLFHRLFAGLGQGSSVMSFTLFLPFVPFCVIAVLGFVLRVNRLFLQTSGGPVLLAWSVSLSEPYGTIAKYNLIHCHPIEN